MIIEYFKLKSKQKEFLNLMAKMKMEHYYLVDIKEVNNGYRLKIGIYAGGSITEFTKHKEELENWLGCISRITPIRFTNMLIMDCCTKDMGNYTFKPVKTTSNQLYIGKTFFNENYFIDINKDCHLAIFGMTGSGKSVLLASILTNLIYNNSNEIELYLCQTHKRDLDFFKNCKPVKISCYTPNETLVILNKALKSIQTRSEKFAQLGIKDISRYNKLMKTKMKRKFYIFEEISLYTPSETDSNEEYEIKEMVWRQILNILKLGRSVGIHIMMLSQRSTVSNLGGKNGDIKSNLTKITFYQNSNTNSQNVLDTNDATKLKDRECCVMDTKGISIIKVPYVDNDMLVFKEYVPEINVYSKDKYSKIIKKEVEYVNFSQKSIEKPKNKPKKCVNKPKTSKKGVILDE